MKRKLFMILPILALAVFMLLLPAAAKAAPPSVLGAPVHLGVSLEFGDYCHFSFGASEELRAYIEARAKRGS